MTPSSRAESAEQAAVGRVMIVEDDRLVALDLETTLNRLGYLVCPSAHSADQAIELARLHRPDLVLMDIRLEGEQDGIGAARTLADTLGIRVVYLTAHSDPATLARAKETNPYGYLLKPWREPDLRCCLEVAVHKAKQSLRRPGQHEATPATGVEPSPLISALSAREIEVLRLIARGYTSKDMAQALSIAKPTVDTYRARIAEKLHVHSRSELVAIARRAGLN